MLFETIRARVAAGILLAVFLTAGNVPAQAASTKNIVLVHGAWVDGSGWSPYTRSSCGAAITSASFRSH